MSKKIIYRKICRACGAVFYCGGKVCSMPNLGESTCHCPKCCEADESHYYFNECPKYDLNDPNIKYMLTVEEL